MSVDTRAVDSRWKDIRDWIQLLVIVFVALSGVWQFVYKDIVKPAREPTALDLTTVLEKVGEQDGMLLIRARITATNPSNRRTYVPALWLNVRAIRLSRTIKVVETDELLTDNDTKFWSDDTVTAFAEIDSWKLVAHRRILFQSDAFYDPKDKTHNEAIFAVPKGEFDYLRMTVTYLFTRYGDDLMHPEWQTNADGEWYAEFRLKPGLFGERIPEVWRKDTESAENWAETTLPLWNQQNMK